MDRVYVFEKLRSRLEVNLGVDPADVAVDSYLVGDLGIDSLDFIELIVSMKRDFGITIRDGEVKAMIGGLAKYLPENDDEQPPDAKAVARQVRVSTLIDLVLDRVGE